MIKNDLAVLYAAALGKALHWIRLTSASLFLSFSDHYPPSSHNSSML
jgi:hypothetical protein